jgi:hypothetical protein
VRIDFREASSGAYLGRGWHGPESWGQWSGPEAEIKFTLNRKQPMWARFWATTYQSQKVMVRLNGREITTFDGDGESPRLVEINLPEDDITEDNTLELRLPQAQSPASLGKAGDNRVLGIGIRWMEVVPAHPEMESRQG